MKDSVKVIGIHKQGSKYKKEEEKENYADFIYPIFNMLKSDVNKTEGNYEKYIYENGNYYLGYIKNGLPNNKGKEYYWNDILEFEGEYLNGERNGKCKELL